MRTTFELDLAIQLDRESPTEPLHAQIKRELRIAIQSGRLRAGTTLPATRALAEDLGVSRGIVVAVYEQLTQEGYLLARGGSRTRVANIRPGTTTAQAASIAVDPPVRYNFQPGVPDPRAFPRSAWLASLARVVRRCDSSHFGYPDLQGPLPTRVALADYLARVRATVGNADGIVLCNGFTHAVSLIAEYFRDCGISRVAVENPTFGRLASLFRLRGITVAAIDVDDAGLDVEQLGRTRAEAVFVTPSHQFPSGASLSAERRSQLLRWAQHRDALIVEDDYDSELRFDRPPLGALQGLAADRVIYVGTTSKIISPALRLGWMLAPPPIAVELAACRRRSDLGSAAIEALAFADFVQRGQLDRFVRTMRPVYRQRHSALRHALSQALPHLRTRGIVAGLHLWLDLPRECDENQLIAAAQAASIRLLGVSSYRAEGTYVPPALALGYGAIDESDIPDGVAALARVISQCSRPSRGLEPNLYAAPRSTSA